MGSAPGLAGGFSPEADGVFVTDDRADAEGWVSHFGDLHPLGLDLWEIRLDRPPTLAEFDRVEYVTGAISAEHVRLVDTFPPGHPLMNMPNRALEGRNGAVITWGTLPERIRACSALPCKDRVTGRSCDTSAARLGCDRCRRGTRST
jgi:hypothetical protein